MAYLGNLTCEDCGLTFTARWGSVQGADEYRCDNDHVLFVEVETKAVLSFNGTASHQFPGAGATLLDLKGLCPLCDSELATGMMPLCPVCGGRDHQATVAGTFGAS